MKAITKKSNRNGYVTTLTLKLSELDVLRKTLLGMEVENTKKQAEIIEEIKRHVACILGNGEQFPPKELPIEDDKSQLNIFNNG